MKDWYNQIPFLSKKMQIQYIDTHSHLYEPEFDNDRPEAMARAASAGVERLLLPAIDRESYERMFEMCRHYPNRCFPMMGLHPTSVNENPAWREDLELVREHLKNPPVERFYGVGEIGLDLYWSSDYRNEQMEAFAEQIELSLQYNLPIAVHTRSAWTEMCEVIEGFRGRGVRGVFHAFSDGVESYARLRECGDFMFGIGGVVTFKKSPLAEVVREIPLEELLLETDCPYLTPVPFRGQRNESAYIPYICEKIAEIKGISIGEVATQTTANAERMFLND